MRFFFLLPTLTMATTVFAQPPAAPATKPAAPPTVVQKASAAPLGYTKGIKAANGKVQALQSAIRRFEPVGGTGPTVYLVAAVHIGEKTYYEQVQQFLNKQDVVLFERVKPSLTGSAPGVVAGVSAAAPKPAAPAASAKTPPPAAASPASLQKHLAKTLNLQFQLDAINYNQPHFRNSDLRWDEMEKLASASGAGTSQSLANLGGALTGTGPLGAMMAGVLGQADTNPAFARMFRRLIVEMVADPDKMSVAFQQQGPDAAKLQNILIAERNKTVLADLKAIKADALTNTTAPVHSVAVFYGAEHMRDMERHLLSDLGYRPAATPDATRWLTAITLAP